jgi:hypothetical protein
MRIKVLADTIDYNAILDYYNTHRSDDEEPLQRLDRTEGGFQIQIPSMKNKICDENNKIRQLRWANGQLVSGFYIGFTEKQTMLLYDALVYALKGNVLLLEN